MKKKVLILGGSYFIGIHVIKELLANNFEVDVLNRGTKETFFDNKVNHIKCDRDNFKNLSNLIKGKEYNYVIDISGLNKCHLNNSIGAIKENGIAIEKYIFISSSAVYKESKSLPFKETSEVGYNKFWTDYGTDKISAEESLIESQLPYIILRPPYIYGENNYVYREAFAFERLEKNKRIYYPESNKKIQFLYVKDLAKIIVTLINENTIVNTVLNVANKESISFESWLNKCSKAAGKEVELIPVSTESLKIDSRDFFPFYEYEYYLDISKLSTIFHDFTPMSKALMNSFDWYNNNKSSVKVKEHFYSTEKSLDSLDL